MPQLIYDVAVTLDGLIAGPDGDITRFPATGRLLSDYLARLQGYHVAVMGRATYEFGYRHGMAVGANPYPHMRTLVFSRTLQLPPGALVEKVTGDATAVVAGLKHSAPGDIYLCGGGRLAGTLLAAGLVDRLRLKRAPALYGAGTPLFDGTNPRPRLRHVDTRDYGDGSILQEFLVENHE